MLVDGNEILLVRQSYTPNVWSLPGGRIKRGEQPLETFQREVREEINLALSSIQELGGKIFTHEYKKDHVTFFRAQVTERNFTIDHFEIIEARWFSLETLPKNIGLVAISGIELLQHE